MFGEMKGDMFIHTGHERLNGIQKWGIYNDYNGIIIIEWSIDDITLLKDVNDSVNEYRIGSIGNDAGSHFVSYCTPFKLDANEYINGYKSYKGFDNSDTNYVICGIEFTTNLNNTHSCISNQPKCNQTSGFIIFSNHYLSGFFGKKGEVINSIGYNMNELQYPICYPGIINNSSSIQCLGTVSPIENNYIGNIIVQDYITLEFSIKFNSLPINWKNMISCGTRFIIHGTYPLIDFTTDVNGIFIHVAASNVNATDVQCNAYLNYDFSLNKTYNISIFIAKRFLIINIDGNITQCDKQPHGYVINNIQPCYFAQNWGAVDALVTDLVMNFYSETGMYYDAITHIYILVYIHSIQSILILYVSK